MEKGVFQAVKKDGTVYYRASFTFRSKHVSLGSFSDEATAHQAYLEALMITSDDKISLENYHADQHVLAFSKWVTLINFRDNHLYFKTPIYLHPKYFDYYLTETHVLKFDVDDLFFYSTHTIMHRGGHLFVSDYGMQLNILNRYGIKNFAVPGKDYRFVNGDNSDFRYKNIDIINRYYGVKKQEENGRISYLSKIHINGDFLIGRFRSETDAAIAYNKAVDTLTGNGIQIQYTKNYIDGMSSQTYLDTYEKIRLPKKIRDYNP
ncbi:MAG: hypothetical protein SPF70_06875 [Lachnospiraceae bacterium]|nr:hypothetical protein [Lachnospiraceae bacterium]